MAETRRCGWAGTDPRMIAYHDHEWGVPVHDDQRFFEFLVLEGAQAGLSWSTVLYKRDSYREAFAAFDPARVARFGKRDVERLLKNAGIIRNRLKIDSAIKNAKAYLAIQEEHGSFDAWVWRFVGGGPIVNRRRAMGDVPSTTPESDAMSKELRKLGFGFVGSTICYAFMQATGMVNDHLVDCGRWAELGGEARAPKRRNQRQPLP